MSTKYIICITGPSTVGKSSFAKIIHKQAIEPIFIIPTVTTRPRSADDDIWTVNIDLEQFQKETFFVHYSNYGILEKDINNFINSECQFAFTICGANEIQNIPTEREYLALLKLNFSKY